ncbi:protein JTB-like [Acanthaster planci]|uniref:Protein JTB-like n=1 Tax=Acanthaster planci TaxID=133434 RepID=A0A8B7ZTH3_ACAPL|nr:protein JTB-like [Acanthaster planci]
MEYSWLLPCNICIQNHQRRSQLRVHVQISAIILLFCTVTNSWGTDTGQEYGKDVLSVDGSRQGERTNQQGTSDDAVMRLLDAKTPAASGAPCWMTESFTTKSPCQACDEHAMKYASYCCNETGFRQLVQCETSDSPVYKSCPKTKWAMEKSFWTFEGVMLAVGLSSFVVVIFRRRALDWEALQRVKKQIANSV